METSESKHMFPMHAVRTMDDSSCCLINEYQISNTSKILLQMPIRCCSNPTNDIFPTIYVRECLFLPTLVSKLVTSPIIFRNESYTSFRVVWSYLS